VRIIFYASDKPREQKLAKAFKVGAIRCGHRCKVLRSNAPIVASDLACVVGVKSKKRWFMLQKAGIPVIMFDKGYSRHKCDGCWEYWRVSYNSHNPTLATLGRIEYGGRRFSQLDFSINRWRKSGDHILLAGSSEKYHNFYGLPEPNTFAQGVVNELKKLTNRPITYRPKPSWRGALPITGATLMKGKIPLLNDLSDCHAVITHGSNTCFEAALLGIPSIVLGNGVVRSISSTELKDVENPCLGKRRRLFNALAYHQWTLKEFESGLAFKTMELWI